MYVAISDGRPLLFSKATTTITNCVVKYCSFPGGGGDTTYNGMEGEAPHEWGFL